MLCCNVRKVQPLTRHLATLDAWITGLRRDQWATRTNIRKVEIDHDHGAIVKLNPLAEWTEEEVWDYVAERGVPDHPLYAQGYTSIGCDPCTRAIEPGEAGARRPLVVGGERAEGVRDPLRGRDRRARARAARDRRGEAAVSVAAGRARPREVAPAEAQAVLAAVRDEERRARLADLLAAVDEGAVEGDDARALGELLELGLQTGRVRALYGPGGEQAALKVYRRLPGGRELGAARRRGERGAPRSRGATSRR